MGEVGNTMLTKHTVFAQEKSTRFGSALRENQLGYNSETTFSYNRYLQSCKSKTDCMSTSRRDMSCTGF